MSFGRFAHHGLAVDLLKRSLRQGRVAHGYLFSAESLDELEALARTLAQTLNCEQRIRGDLTDDCCDQCRVCRRIAEDQHVDVHWVRPESKSRWVSVDQIRELMREVFLKPTEATFKVGVVVAADRLNSESANAFLKTLEEPPSGSILILLTTEPSRVLETIVSRCLRLSFGGVGGRGSVVSTHAAAIADFARLFAGGAAKPLDRYRLLSALVSAFARLRSEVETSLTSRSPLARYEDADPKVRSRWEDELSAAIEAGYRHQRSLFLLSLQWWFRDVWLGSMGFSDTDLMYPEHETLTRSLAGRIKLEDALWNLDVLEDITRQLGTNVQESLALEVGVLQLRS